MVRRLKTLVGLCLFAGTFTILMACNDAENVDQLEGDTLSTDALPTEADTVRSIYGVLQDEGQFSRFITAVDSAGLNQTLSGPGPFTVFAPSDEAFDESGAASQELLLPENRDQLRGLLLYHIASGEESAADLQDGATIQTLEGGELNVSGSTESLVVDGADVMESDIRASNGVVHVINTILRPDADGEGS